MRFLLFAVALVALAGCSKPTQQQPAANSHAAATRDVGPHKGVDRSHKGQPAPAAAFKDPDGGDISLKDFRGTPVLLNLWATWCAPCVKELPTLGRLAKAHEKDGALQVIAISQDSGPHPSVVAFLDSKAPELAPYQDSTMALSGKLGAEVLPTSILFDAQGREVWRYVGDLDWTSAEAAKLLSEANAPKGS
jgi:thiol-disulfide isomerase/thioredoxin